MRPYERGYSGSFNLGGSLFVDCHEWLCQCSKYGCIVVYSRNLPSVLIHSDKDLTRLSVSSN